MNVKKINLDVGTFFVSRAARLNNTCVWLVYTNKLVMTSSITHAHYYITYKHVHVHYTSDLYSCVSLSHVHAYKLQP